MMHDVDIGVLATKVHCIIREHLIVARFRLFMRCRWQLLVKGMHTKPILFCLPLLSASDT